MSTTNTQRRRSHQPTAPARAAPTQRDSRSRSRVGRAGPRNNHAEPRGRQQDRERSASPRRRAVTAPRSPPRRTPSPQARPGGNPDDPGGGEDSSGSDSDDDGHDDDQIFAEISLKARIIGRDRALFESMSLVLQEGLLPEADRGTTAIARERYSIYCDIVALMPALPDWIARFGVTKVARLLTKGRNSARGADVDSFKANLSLMDRDIPPCNIDRHMLGFNNDVTGQYICAITLDFTDPLTKRRLLSKELVPSYRDFSFFLWEGGVVDMNNLAIGFMKNDIIVKGAIAVLLSPSAAKGAGGSGKGKRKGNAAIHGIRNMSIYALAYIATLIRFVLPDQLVWGTTGHGCWPFNKFYYALIDMMKTGLTAQQLEELLQWWNEKIFAGLADDSDEDDDDADTITARMRRQAAANAVNANQDAAEGEGEADQEQDPDPDPDVGAAGGLNGQAGEVHGQGGEA